jgi:hypothetical protein
MPSSDASCGDVRIVDDKEPVGLTFTYATAAIWRQFEA